MIDEDVNNIVRECEEIFKKMDKIEEIAKGEVVKYFDRIHDKLFAYQLFFLAGYISLIAIPSINISIWWLLIPTLCVGRLICIDWMLMEQNRKLSNIFNLNKTQIDELVKEQNNTTLASLEVILESIIITIGFAVALATT